MPCKIAKILDKLFLSKNETDILLVSALIFDRKLQCLNYKL